MEVGVGNSPETAGVAMEFPVFDGAELSSPPIVPPRLRRRLTETKSSTSPSTVEEIEAKLRSADLRRQKFYESLSSKARPKRRSPQYANEHNLGQRLEAKLQAAEQKRMQILKAHSQRRATLWEKTSQSLLRRNALQNKYKEHVHAAIYQKRATAEKNRLELLGADKEKTHARRLQARKVAKSVSQQQETESLKLSESLQDKLQRAKRQRAAYLMQKVSLHNFVGANSNEKTQKQADHLSRILLRCWKKFLKQGTTLDLAKSYHDLNINAGDGKSIPFENFAILMETSSTLRTTKALLDRFETRYRVLLAVASGTNSHGQEDIDHLLTRVISPNVDTPRSPVHSRYVRKARAATKAPVKLSRYQVRVVLSAYMILGHPNAVFSGQGVRETALAKSAKKFVQEFELLIDIILNGPSQKSGEESNPALARCCSFRSQLAAFDAAWCSYLNSFVVWKVKDVESLENDLVRAACQMEISMMQKYKPTPEGDDNALTHDVKAFQKQMQVTEHQKLLREKVMHLSGEAGIERMQNALSDTRRKYFQSKEHGSPAESSVESSVAHISSPIAGPDERSDDVVQSLSNATMPPLEDLGSSVATSSGLVNHSGEMLGMENVFIVNEFLHGRNYSVADSSHITQENQKVRETMEKAFWDGISDSIQQEKYDHIVVLMKEVRDELYEMSPKSWKPKITEVIDLDILSQLLSSHRLDMEYLGTIMEFALVSLQKLSAVAHENQLKESHKKVVLELAELCRAGDGSNRSHAIALMKGLRFVLEQIQVLKQEISKARMKILEPLLKGPTGLEYLGKAFAKLYGPPSDALNCLPMTMQWLSSVVPGKDEEWSEHKRAILEGSSSERPVIPSTALRTGGSFSSHRLQTSASMNVTNIAGTDNRYPECKGEKGDLVVRLGLVKLVNNVNGVTQEELPETLKLNFIRLRAVQAQLQKITVIATSILVLRQTLVMEQMISSFEDMESTILRCSLQLSRILDTVVDAGLEQIVQLLSKTAEKFDKSNDSAKTQSRRVVMARTLRKSLQAGDPVFVRVSRAVYLATRGVVLAGSGTHGRGLAEKALRQVGAAILTDDVVAQGAVLGVMNRVSENVHGPWYARLIQNM